MSEEETTTEVEETTTEEQPSEQPDIFSMSDEEYEEYLNRQPEKSEEPSQDDQPEASENAEETPSSGDSKESQKEEIDYKLFYDTILQPFKANGKTVTPRGAEDVISLMQMGAGYTKKMQMLSPVKKAAESLRKAGIDAEQLNFLIDVHRGDKNAIKSLLKKHSLDPTSFDMDEETPYTPNNNLATDEDVQFSDMIMEVDASLPKIREILDKQWDEESKKELLNNPKLLRGLHQEIQLGRFDKIQEILDNEKALGRYDGVSDIRAYSDIVTKLVYMEQERLKQQYEENKKAKTSKAKAAPTKGRAPKSQGKKISDFDLLNMSDEDFAKIAI